MKCIIEVWFDGRLRASREAMEMGTVIDSIIEVEDLILNTVSRAISDEAEVGDTIPTVSISVRPLRRKLKKRSRK